MSDDMKHGDPEHGLVRIHNHHTPEGQAQHAQITDRICRALEHGHGPEFIASDVLVALLNPAKRHPWHGEYERDDKAQLEDT